MLDVLKLKDAQEITKNLFENVVDIENIEIEKATGSIVASDVLACDDLPQFKRSTVDGYAVIASSCYGCSQTIPCILKQVGEVKMGELANIGVSSEECVYVPTGGCVPDNCDAVVMIEDTTKIDNEVMIFKPIKFNENVINVGDDIKKDSLIIGKGTKLNAPKIGLLAGNGISKVNVYKKFNYSVISTGDEIIPINEKLRGCKIRDINSYAIASKLEEYGNLDKKFLVEDDLNKLKAAIKECLMNSKVVFISGGSSVGTRDYTIKAIEEIGGTIDVHGIAIKPGKPTIVAHVDDKVIIGLPGHPMAALMSLQLVFIESLNSLFGFNEEKIVAKTLINFPSAPGKETIMPVKLTQKDNELYCEPVFYKSGLINILSMADGYIIIPENEEGIYKDTNVMVYSI